MEAESSGLLTITFSEWRSAIHSPQYYVTQTGWPVTSLPRTRTFRAKTKTLDKPGWAGHPTHQHEGNNKLWTNNIISKNLPERNHQVSVKISVKNDLSCAYICRYVYPYSKNTEEQTRKHHQNIYNDYCQVLWSWVIFNFSLLTLSLRLWQWFFIRNIISNFKN